MTLRGSLVVFAVGTLLAWAAWALVLNSVPPELGGLPAEVFFFGALFFALTGTLTILGILGRMRRSPSRPALHVSDAFRQGLLLSLATVGALVLQRFRLLHWWSILMLALVLFVIDLLTARRRPTSPASFHDGSSEAH